MRTRLDTVMAHVIDEFKDFTLATNRAISRQVCEAFEQEMYDDVQGMIQKWTQTIGERIDARLEEVGLDSDFSVTIRWTNIAPVIEIVGKTNTGVESDTAEDS